MIFIAVSIFKASTLLSLSNDGIELRCFHIQERLPAAAVSDHRKEKEEQGKVVLG